MKLRIDKPLGELTREEREGLVDRRPSDEPELRRVVGNILDRVKEEQDAALHAMARELDKVELDALEVPRESWDKAVAALAPTRWVGPPAGAALGRGHPGGPRIDGHPARPRSGSRGAAYAAGECSSGARRVGTCEGRDHHLRRRPRMR